MLFALANLPYWIFLAIGVGLYLLVIFSGGGEEDVDVELDADLELDLDVNVDGGLPQLHAETDIETDLDSDSGLNPLQFLSWIGFGKAPLMLLLAFDFSIWGATGWIINVIVGSITGQMPVRLFGLAGLVMLSSLIISLFLGSLISRPLGKIFASFGEDVRSDRVIGCVGTVTSKSLPYLIDGKIGQVDVYDLAGNLITVSTCLPQWANVIPRRGDRVLIIEQGNHSFLAIAKDSSDEDKWLNDSDSLRDCHPTN